MWNGEKGITCTLPAHRTDSLNDGTVKYSLSVLQCMNPLQEGFMHVNLV